MYTNFSSTYCYRFLRVHQSPSRLQYTMAKSPFVVRSPTDTFGLYNQFVSFSDSRLNPSQSSWWSTIFFLHVGAKVDGSSIRLSMLLPVLRNCLLVSSTAFLATGHQKLMFLSVFLKSGRHGWRTLLMLRNLRTPTVLKKQLDLGIPKWPKRIRPWERVKIMGR